MGRRLHDYWKRRGRSAADDRVVAGLAVPWRTGTQIERLRERPRAPGESFRFAVLGDCEPGRFWILRALFNRKGVFSRQLGSIRAQSVDFTIQLGDMVSRGVPGQYARFFGELESSGVSQPYLTVIGNHDRLYPHGHSAGSRYHQFFGPSNYFFDRGAARFVVLDSSWGRLTQAQLRWLRLVLKGDRRKLVFTHMPPSLLHLWGDGAARRRWGGFSEGAREFADTVSEMGVERVYMGHVHGFGVQDCGGVRYILTGGGGSPLYPSGVTDRFYHYLTVAVGPAGISDRVHELDGSSFAIPAGKVVLPAG